MGKYMLEIKALYPKKRNLMEPKIFVPKGYRLSILKLFHDENYHVGFDKVMHKVRQCFWFTGMAAFVKKYTYHCLICIKKGMFRSKIRAVTSY